MRIRTRTSRLTRIWMPLALLFAAVGLAVGEPVCGPALEANDPALGTRDCVAIGTQAIIDGPTPFPKPQPPKPSPTPGLTDVVSPAEQVYVYVRDVVHASSERRSPRVP